MSSSPSAGSSIEAGEEAGLVLSSQQGDVGSYRDLVGHHRFALYGTALDLTGDRAQATRLMQRVLVLGWDQIEHLPVGRPFLPWAIALMQKIHSGARRRTSSSPPPRATRTLELHPGNRGARELEGPAPAERVRNESAHPGGAPMSDLIDQAMRRLRPRAATGSPAPPRESSATWAAAFVGVLYMICVWWGIQGSERARLESARRPRIESASSQAPPVASLVPARERAPGSDTISAPADSTPAMSGPSGDAVEPTPVVAPPPQRPRVRKKTAVKPPAASAPAQVVGLLCGTVRVAAGRPIPAATLKLSDLGIVIHTDLAGRFCVTIPGGKHPLMVTSAGYEPVYQSVDIGRQTTELNFNLIPSRAPADSQRR